RYRPEELGQKIIFNLDAFGRFTKASFLMGGMDYALYHDLAGGADPGFDPVRLDRALARRGDAVLPGAFPSQFSAVKGGLLANGTVITVAALKAGERPAWFRDPVLAHDLHNVSLALQSEVALRRTGMGPDTTIFIEGGFRQNATFLAVLASLLPTNTIACTNLA